MLPEAQMTVTGITIIDVLFWVFGKIDTDPVGREPVSNSLNAILANLANIHLIDLLDYQPFVYLMKHCYIALTDSGGIQQEAPSLGKSVLAMRDVTDAQRLFTLAQCA